MFDKIAAIMRGRGWIVIAGCVLIAALVTGSIFFSELDLQDAVLHYAEISQNAAENPIIAYGIGTGFFAILVVLLLPGVPLLAIPLGLILGWGMAIAISLSGTAIGISILYGLATWILPERFGKEKSNAMDRLARGLRKDAVGYMMVLRLMPPVPFTFLNVALPTLRVPYVQFLVTTILGMLPRIVVYCFVGEGLRGVIDERVQRCADAVPTCTPDFSPSDFITTEVVVATVLLVVVSLVPMLVQRIVRAREAGTSDG